jgi:pimeloyl-ACP methyl ester carboxylesterase
MTDQPQRTGAPSAPTSRDLTFAAEDGTTLAGTFACPADSAPRAPAALLLSGSGPLDRHSNTPDQELNVSSAIATTLAGIGVASLRFDKRGVGESGGDYVSSGFHQECADAASALEALRRVPGVDPRRVGVIGHSTGSTIAARLAGSDDQVHHAVLLCCATSDGAAVMTWQTDRIADTMPGPGWLLGRRLRRSQRRCIDAIINSEEAVIRIDGREEPALWMREYRAHDPKPDLGAIRCPVLAITGQKDIQVDPAELDELARLTGGPTTTLAPPDLTHILRSSPHRPGILRYRKQLGQPVDAGLLRHLGDWIDATLTARGSP